MPTMPIANIEIGARHRRELGDLSELAESINSEGLLQPIGITEDRVLVFGERRLRAVQDILHWPDIECRIVNVSSIAAGEWAENELHKNFTPSERVAILRTIGRKPLGDQRRSQNIATVDAAARMAGLGNRETARQAETVVDHGVSELLLKMDGGGVAISVAAKIARLDPDEQTAVLDLEAVGEGNSFREALEAVIGGQRETPTEHDRSASSEPVIVSPGSAGVGLADLQNSWRQADEHVRRQFLRWLSESEPHMFKETIVA